MNMTRELLIRDVAELNTFGAEIYQTAKQNDANIQRLLCSAVVHLHKHGTIAVANDAIKALSKGLRTNAARDFMLEFAPVNWNEKKKAFVFAATKRIENDFEGSERCTEMMATLWLDFRPEPEYRAFDTEAALKAVIAKAQKHLEKGNPEKDNVSQEELDQLAALLAKITGDRTAAKAAAAQAAVAEQGE